MTRQEMIEKLNQIEKGKTITRNGKTYRVIYANPQGGKLNRIDVGLLENGLSQTYTAEGRFLAAGKTITISNVEHCTWYAQGTYMNWEFID